MAIDWGQATQVGGVGFGIVFLVLVLLSVVLWLIGLVFRRIGTGKEETSDNKKGA
jgi:Na+-transporting methylmalonyl-CoA/oxaloacetate decarboxylase gamma subunit